jgi:N-acetylmuramoyl-L-alanine amidase
LNNPKRIIIHCSATDDPLQDNLDSIYHLHTSPMTENITWGNYKTHGKQFRDIGYHYFITKDGQLHEGRPENEQGAGASGYNKDTLHICLSGEYNFSAYQFSTLRGLLDILKIKYGYDIEIIGHCDVNHQKTCPNFNVKELLL